MTTVLVHHRVLDYDVWKQEYDRIVAGPLGSAVREYRVWRGIDDPNLVVVAETYASREAADEASAHPDLPDAFARAGVVMSSVQIDFLAEVEAGSSTSRRRFQPAREQAAAGASVEHDGRAREARRWPTRGPERAAERCEAGDTATADGQDCERRAA